MSWQAAFWVALGGAIGSVLRWATVVLTVQRFGPGFPLGTLTVNVVGSFLIGIVAGLADSATPGLSPTMRLFLATGILGGFTTFSSFSLDTLNVERASGSMLALLYVAISVCVGLAAALGGVALARALRS
ncbi:MAG: camphor resistance protein CrcB [Candidatus Eremiobacteraeota bacterium]|nr:camphor resistance protein CrcB [Candidatus Eremiobacteraeota bacterium]